MVFSQALHPPLRQVDSQFTCINKLVCLLQLPELPRNSPDSTGENSIPQKVPGGGLVRSLD